MGDDTEDYFVHFNGHSWFVKTADFFRAQGGDREPWGKAWRPLHATGGIEGARALADDTWGREERAIVQQAEIDRLLGR